jgi:hypothetical protein
MKNHRRIWYVISYLGDYFKSSSSAEQHASYRRASVPGLSCLVIRRGEQILPMLNPLSHIAVLISNCLRSVLMDRE